MFSPGIGNQERTTAQNHGGLVTPAIREAAPRPVLCAADESGSQGMPLHMATDANEIAGALDLLGLETILIDRILPGGLAPAPEPDSMGSSYPMQQA